MEYKIITNASVEVNGGCNYVCEMCPQSTGREKTFLKKMPIDLFKDVCSQLQVAGCKQIDLQGSGEPLLNRNISDYVSIAKQHNLEVSMVSNGYNLSHKISDQLIDVGLDSIRISVIGYNKETYTQARQHREGHDARDFRMKNVEMKKAAHELWVLYVDGKRYLVAKISGEYYAYKSKSGLRIKDIMKYDAVGRTQKSLINRIITPPMQLIRNENGDLIKQPWGIST